MNINEFYQKLDGYFAQHDTDAIEKFMIDSLNIREFRSGFAERSKHRDGSRGA